MTDDAAGSTDASLSCEVLQLTRDLIRLDTTNAPGNETRAATHLRDDARS